MTNARFQWLLDMGLPHVSTDVVDALHAADVTRVPGPVGLREACSWHRTLVTCNQEFKGPWASPIVHPGIVVFEEAPNEGEDLVRNLLHLEFRLRQHGGVSLEGNRFLLRPDRGITQILPNGFEADLEQWKEVRMSRLSTAPTW